MSKSKDKELSELKEYGKQVERIADLEQSLQRAHREVDRLKNHQAELRQAMGNAVKDNMHLCKFGQVKPPPKQRKVAKEEVAVSMVSDLQIGKVTPEYNVEICEKRIIHLAERIGRITRIHRKSIPVRNLHVWLLGDIVEGELIFPGQAHQTEASLYRQVLNHGPRILVEFFRQMLLVYERVDVLCVPGNHGAIGGKQRKDIHLETNADLFLYEHVRKLFEAAGEKRISFTLPPMEKKEQAVSDKPWYLIDEIGNYSCLLFHGNQIQAYNRFPWYGFGHRVKGWNVMGHNEKLPMRPFKDSACGHFHQDAKFPIAGITVRCNGSTESYGSHVLETMAEGGIPSQHFMFVEPKRGRVTAEYQLDLSLA